MQPTSRNSHSRSLYATLGVLPSAVPEELRRAFKRRALETHPDKGGSPAEFQAVLSAFETLADTVSRARYDRAQGTNKSTVGTASKPEEGGAASFKRCKRASKGQEARVDSKRQRRPQQYSSGPGSSRDGPSAASNNACGQAPAACSTGGRRVRRRPLTKTTTLLGLIFDCLRKIRPERRREVIAHKLTARQRIELERWATGQQTASKAVTAVSRARPPRQVVSRDSEHDSSSSSSSEDEILTLEDANFDRMSHDDGGDVRSQSQNLNVADQSLEEHTSRHHEGTGCADASLAALQEQMRSWQGQEAMRGKLSGESCPSRGNHLFRGIARHFRYGQVWYCASISIGVLCLYTKEDLSLDRVIDFLLVLTSIRERVGSDSYSEGLPEQLHAAVQSACKEAHLSADKDLGLRLKGRISAHQWIGCELTAPSYRFNDWQHCMETWRKLIQARGRANRGGHVFHFCSPVELERQWRHIREVYIEIWTSAGQDAGALGTRLDTMEAAHQPQRERCLEHWNRTSMAKEEQRHRALRRSEIRLACKSAREALATARDARREEQLARRAQRREQCEAKQERLERLELRLSTLLARWARVEQERAARGLAARLQAARRTRLELKASAALAAARQRAVQRAERALRLKQKREGCAFKDLTMDEILSPSRKTTC